MNLENYFRKHIKNIPSYEGVDPSYKLASEAEMRAVEQSYYSLRDDINQFKYDLKELERQLSGGY